MIDLHELDRYRDRVAEQLLYGGFESDTWERDAGYFLIPAPLTGRTLKVIASSSRIPGSEGWDHVSVSLPNRCPNWPEMDFIKRRFFAPHDVCFQLHPAEAEHISNHPFCLHIWRNANQPVPLPPAHFVGVKELGELGR